jgi:hypothetical protein
MLRLWRSGILGVPSGRDVPRDLGDERSEDRERNSIIDIDRAHEIP